MANKLANKNFRLRELINMPTISQNNFMDRKVDQDGVRHWLSRMTVEDGEPYNHHVIVEVFNETTSEWEHYRDYQAVG